MRTRPALVALILAAVAALFASRLALDSDLARLIPEESGSWRAAARLLERIAVIDIEGSAEDAEEFARRLAPDYGVRRLPTEGELLDVVELVRNRAALYVTDFEAIERKLSDIPGRVRTLARRLQEPDAATQSRWAAVDPLGIGLEAVRGLSAITAGFGNASLDSHGLVSGDRKHRLLLVRPGFAAVDTKRTDRFLAAIDRASDGLRVRHLGAHRSTRDNARMIRRDATRASILGSIVVLLLAWLVFRNPVTALLAIAPAAFGALLALGIFALFNASIPTATLGFACVLLGITIDYAIHTTCATRTPARALLIGATTTGAAFLCLRASSVPGLRDMGLIGALGVLAAAIFAIKVLRPRGARGIRRLAAVARRLQSRPVLVAVLLALPFVLYGVRKLRFDGNPMALSRLSPEAAGDEAAIRAVWGDTFTTTTVIVQGATLEETLQRNDRAALALEDRPHASLASLLVSQRTQRERWEKWRQFWTAERIAATAAQLEAATEGTPFRRDAFAPFVAWLTRRPEPVRAEDLPPAIWEDRIVETKQGWMMSTPVFDPDLETLPDAIVVNPRGMVARVARLVADETVRLGLLAAAAVAFVVLLWFGLFLPVFVVMLPLLASCAFTLGLLGWLGLPVTLANAAFVVFIFGLAVDYGVFLVEARMRRAAGWEDRVAEADGAVVLCALTTCVGFGALLTASHPVLHSIGATALAGIASSLLLVQSLVPRLWPAPPDGTTVEGLYRFHGPMLRRYAAAKAKRDPIVAQFAALPAQRSVLVAGCGYGIMAAQRLLRFSGESLTGIDSDARKIEAAAAALRRFTRTKLRTADLRDADLGSHSLVTAVDILHYWPEAEQRSIAQRLADAVEPGGVLLLREGCSDRAGHRSVDRWERFATAIRFTRGRGALHFRTEQGWRTLMADCGLMVDQEPVGRGPGSNIALLCRKPKS